jgi:hypothetical protein
LIIFKNQAVFTLFGLIILRLFVDERGYLCRALFGEAKLLHFCEDMFLLPVVRWPFAGQKCCKRTPASKNQTEQL